MRQRLALACNIAIIAMVVISWYLIMLAPSNEPLASRGFSALKYFTVLSNTLEGAVSIAYAWCLVARMRSGRPIPRSIHLLKYVAAVAVALTFATVAVFLGHLYGYAAMFSGYNLPLHLLVPVAAMIEFCLLDTEYALPLRATFIACIPMVLYGIGYFANIFINGIGVGTRTNDWYGFASAGLQWTPVVFALMFAVTWLLAASLRFVNERVRRAQEPHA